MSSYTEKSARSWLSWPIAVGGWLLCAGMCLILTIGLEAWPDAYDLFLPAVLVILFANILVYLFVSTRLAAQPVKLLAAVLKICVAEGLLTGAMYILGRYAVGS